MGSWRDESFRVALQDWHYEEIREKIPLPAERVYRVDEEPEEQPRLWDIGQCMLCDERGHTAYECGLYDLGIADFNLTSGRIRDRVSS